MLQGLYAAASGMEATQNQFDAISNDLANVDTPGYQSAEVGFEDLLYSGGGASSGSTQATGSGAAAFIVGRNQAEGSLQTTGRSLDVALVGPGFLQVRQPGGGLALTRNGALQLDSRRQLTDQQGNVLSPPITLPAGVDPSQVSIAPNGVVSAGSQRLGQLKLLDVPAPDKLQPLGGSLFAPTAASGGPRAAAGTTLQQGALEQSNVDVSQEMTEMIQAQRAYQMASQAISYQNQMLQIANQIKQT